MEMKFFRPIAGATLFFFLSAQMGQAGAANFLQSVPKATPVSSLYGETAHVNFLDSLRLPESLGQIKTVFHGSRKAVIVHIQDAHVNEEAQRNIAKTLEFFIRNHNLRLVALEGAQGELDTKIFSVIPDAQVRRKIADYYLHHGRLSGPEYLAIVKRPEILLYGIEDGKHYRKNRAAYLDALDVKERDEAILAGLGKVLRGVSRFVFSEKMRELLRRRLSFEDQESEILPYARFLIEEARGFGLTREGYAQLRSFLSLVDLEKKIDKDTAFYVQVLSPLLYHQLSSSLNIGLFEELADLEKKVKRKLFRSSQEARLDELWHIFEIYRKIFEFSLAPEDADFFLSHREKFQARTFQSFLKPLLEKYHFAYNLPDQLGLLDEDLARVERFYTAALVRDKVLIRKTIQKLKTEGTGIAAVVTGGFHTPGIQKYLQSRDYSYVVVTPKISRLSDRKAEANLYKQAIRGLPTRLEKTLTEFYPPKSSQLNDPRFQLAVERMMPPRSETRRLLLNLQPRSETRNYAPALSALKLAGALFSIRRKGKGQNEIRAAVLQNYSDPQMRRAIFRFFEPFVSANYYSIPARPPHKRGSGFLVMPPRKGRHEYPVYGYSPKGRYSEVRPALGIRSLEGISFRDGSQLFFVPDVEASFVQNLAARSPRSEVRKTDVEEFLRLGGYFFGIHPGDAEAGNSDQAAAGILRSKKLRKFLRGFLSRAYRELGAANAKGRKKYPVLIRFAEAQLPGGRSKIEYKFMVEVPGQGRRTALYEWNPPDSGGEPYTFPLNLLDTALMTARLGDSLESYGLRNTLRDFGGGEAREREIAKHGTLRVTLDEKSNPGQGKFIFDLRTHKKQKSAILRVGIREAGRGERFEEENADTVGLHFLWQNKNYELVILSRQPEESQNIYSRGLQTAISSFVIPADRRESRNPEFLDSRLKHAGMTTHTKSQSMALRSIVPLSEKSEPQQDAPEAVKPDFESAQTPALATPQIQYASSSPWEYLPTVTHLVVPPSPSDVPEVDVPPLKKEEAFEEQLQREMSELQARLDQLRQESEVQSEKLLALRRQAAGGEELLRQGEQRLERLRQERQEAEAALREHQREGKSLGSQLQVGRGQLETLERRETELMEQAGRLKTQTEELEIQTQQLAETNRVLQSANERLRQEQLQLETVTSETIPELSRGLNERGTRRSRLVERIQKHRRSLPPVIEKWERDQTEAGNAAQRMPSDFFERMPDDLFTKAVQEPSGSSAATGAGAVLQKKGTNEKKSRTSFSTFSLSSLAGFSAVLFLGKSGLFPEKMKGSESARSAQVKLEEEKKPRRLMPHSETVDKGALPRQAAGDQTVPPARLERNLPLAEAARYLSASERSILAAAGSRSLSGAVLVILQALQKYQVPEITVEDLGPSLESGHPTLIDNALKVILAQKHLEVPYSFVRNYLLSADSRWSAIDLILEKRIPVPLAEFQKLGAKVPSDKTHLWELEGVSEIVNASAFMAQAFGREMLARKEPLRRGRTEPAGVYHALLSGVLMSRLREKFPAEGNAPHGLEEIKMPLLHFLERYRDYLETLSSNGQFDFAQRAARLILEEREKQKEDILLSKDHHLIIAAGSEGSIGDEEKLRAIFENFPVKSIRVFKGSEDDARMQRVKQAYLAAVSQVSRNREPALILKSMHGSTDFQNFSSSPAGFITAADEARVLGGRHVTVIDAACYGCDFGTELLKAGIRRRSGRQEDILPRIMTLGNRNSEISTVPQVNILGIFGRALQELPGPELRVKDLFEAARQSRRGDQKHTFDREDPSFTFPVNAEAIEEKLKIPPRFRGLWPFLEIGKKDRQPDALAYGESPSPRPQEIALRSELRGRITTFKSYLRTLETLERLASSIDEDAPEFSRLEAFVEAAEQAAFLPDDSPRNSEEQERRWAEFHEAAAAVKSAVKWPPDLEESLSDLLETFDEKGHEEESAALPANPPSRPARRILHGIVWVTLFLLSLLLDLPARFFNPSQKTARKEAGIAVPAATIPDRTKTDASKALLQIFQETVTQETAKGNQEIKPPVEPRKLPPAASPKREPEARDGAKDQKQNGVPVRTVILDDKQIVIREQDGKMSYELWRRSGKNAGADSFHEYIGTIHDPQERSSYFQHHGVDLDYHIMRIRSGNADEYHLWEIPRPKKGYEEFYNGLPRRYLGETRPSPRSELRGKSTLFLGFFFGGIVGAATALFTTGLWKGPQPPAPRVQQAEMVKPEPKKPLALPDEDRRKPAEQIQKLEKQVKKLEEKQAPAAEASAQMDLSFPSYVFKVLHVKDFPPEERAKIDFAEFNLIQNDLKEILPLLGQPVDDQDERTLYVLDWYHYFFKPYFILQQVSGEGAQRFVQVLKAVIPFHLRAVYPGLGIKSDGNLLPYRAEIAEYILRHPRNPEVWRRLASYWTRYRTAQKLPSLSLPYVLGDAMEAVPEAAAVLQLNALQDLRFISQRNLSAEFLLTTFRNKFFESGLLAKRPDVHNGILFGSMPLSNEGRKQGIIEFFLGSLHGLDKPNRRDIRGLGGLQRDLSFSLSNAQRRDAMGILERAARELSAKKDLKYEDFEQVLKELQSKDYISPLRSFGLIDRSRIAQLVGTPFLESPAIWWYWFQIYAPEANPYDFSSMPRELFPFLPEPFPAFPPGFVYTFRNLYGASSTGSAPSQLASSFAIFGDNLRIAFPKPPFDVRLRFRPSGTSIFDPETYFLFNYKEPRFAEAKFFDFTNYVQFNPLVDLVRFSNEARVGDFNARFSTLAPFSGAEGRITSWLLAFYLHHPELWENPNARSLAEIFGTGKGVADLTQNFRKLYDARIYQRLLGPELGNFLTDDFLERLLNGSLGEVIEQENQMGLALSGGAYIDRLQLELRRHLAAFDYDSGQGLLLPWLYPEKWPLPRPANVNRFDETPFRRGAATTVAIMAMFNSYMERLLRDQLTSAYAAGIVKPEEILKFLETKIAIRETAGVFYYGDKAKLRVADRADRDRLDALAADAHRRSIPAEKYNAILKTASDPQVREEALGLFKLLAGEKERKQFDLFAENHDTADLHINFLIWWAGQRKDAGDAEEWTKLLKQIESPALQRDFSKWDNARRSQFLELLKRIQKEGREKIKNVPDIFTPYLKKSQPLKEYPEIPRKRSRSELKEAIQESAEFRRRISLAEIKSRFQSIPEFDAYFAGAFNRSEVRRQLERLTGIQLPKLGQTASAGYVILNYDPAIHDLSVMKAIAQQVKQFRGIRAALFGNPAELFNLTVELDSDARYFEIPKVSAPRFLEHAKGSLGITGEHSDQVLRIETGIVKSKDNLPLRAALLAAVPLSQGTVVLVNFSALAPNARPLTVEELASSALFAALQMERSA